MLQRSSTTPTGRSGVTLALAVLSVAALASLPAAVLHAQPGDTDTAAVARAISASGWRCHVSAVGWEYSGIQFDSAAPTTAGGILLYTGADTLLVDRYGRLDSTRRASALPHAPDYVSPYDDRYRQGDDGQLRFRGADGVERVIRDLRNEIQKRY